MDKFSFFQLFLFTTGSPKIIIYYDPAKCSSGSSLKTPTDTDIYTYIHIKKKRVDRLSNYPAKELHYEVHCLYNATQPSEVKSNNSVRAHVQVLHQMHIMSGMRALRPRGCSADYAKQIFISSYENARTDRIKSLNAVNYTSSSELSCQEIEEHTLPF